MSGISLTIPDRKHFSLTWYIVPAAILLGHAPLVTLHLRSLWQKEQYQYFPFVIGAVVWLLMSRWNEAPRSPSTATGSNCWPQAFLASSAVLLIASMLLVSPWLAMVSLNIGLAAVFACLGRARQIPYLWGIWLLLWLMVPLPFGLDNRLIVNLQRLSSRLSSTILDTAGIEHLMAGNVLTLMDKQLFVDEACSGIVSVMSIVTCAMIYAVWRNRTFPHLMMLTLIGIFWAVVLNVVRISTIAAAQYYYDIDLSSGTSHEILGLILFSVMFLALVSTDYLLLPMMSPIEVEDHWKSNRLIRLWNYLNQGHSDTEEIVGVTSDAPGKVQPSLIPSSAMPRALAISIPFLLLGIVQLSWLPSTDTAEAREAIKHALALQEDFAPAKVGPWELDSFEAIEREAYSDFGRYSRTYYYRHQENGYMANVSLDFPYIGGWHDLCVCYRNAGWTIHERLVQSQDSSSMEKSTLSQEEGWQYVEGELENTEGQKAFVLFAGFDVLGQPATPSSELVFYRSWFRLRRRLLYNLTPQLFQVQVFAIGSYTTDESARADLQQLLLDIRPQFRDRIASKQPITNQMQD